MTLQAYDRREDAFPAHRQFVLVGPPGTGKTYTCVNDHLARAVEQGVPLGSILCCSYSRAAAGEIADRVSRLTGVDRSKLRRVCSTIHSEAYHRVRVDEPELRVFDNTTNREVAEEDDGGDIGLRETRGQSPEERALFAWDYIRNRMLKRDSAEGKRVLAEAAGGACSWSVLDRLIAEYEQRKADAGNRIDFTDMLERALVAPVRALSLLIVDEAQDCTPLQAAVVERWAQHAEHVLVVGDPDQAVHVWMGATPHWMLGLIRNPRWTARVLARSFRVPVKQHAIARSIITQNIDREDAPYEPTEVTGEVMEANPESVVMEALRVACTETTDRDRAQTMLILVRGAKAATRYSYLLSRAGVPFSNERGASILNRKMQIEAVTALLGLLKHGEAPGHGLAKAVDLIPAKWAEQHRLWSGTKKALIAALGNGGTPTPPPFMLNIDAWRRLGQRNIMNAMKFVSESLEDWEALLKRFGVRALHEPPQVTITTMHASKGREADVVAICALDPWGGERSDEDWESERRVLYVAATRSRWRTLIDTQGRDLFAPLVAAFLAVQEQAEEVPF